MGTCIYLLKIEHIFLLYNLGIYQFYSDI